MRYHFLYPCISQTPKVWKHTVGLSVDKEPFSYIADGSEKRYNPHEGQIGTIIQNCKCISFDPEIPLLGNSSDSCYLNMDEMIYVQVTEISVALFLWQKTRNNAKNPSMRDQLNKLWWIYTFCNTGQQPQLSNVEAFDAPTWKDL